MKNTNYIIFLFFIAPCFKSCKKFIQIDPPQTQVVTQTVFTDDATATSAIKGIYSSMVNNTGFLSGSVQSVTHLGGLSADEFDNFFSPLDPFAQNSLLPTTPEVLTSVWTPGYQFIYYANAVLKGLDNSTGVSETVSNQLKGEAKFIRALCHFYLVNLFGRIPIATTTDYELNNLLSRSDVPSVYDQIISDLKDAQGLLSEDYVISGNERIRPNKWAATALLARVYLYKDDWLNAEEQATLVIENGTFGLQSDLNLVFVKNSDESIWQLMPVNPSYNTNEARLFIPLESATINPDYIALNDELINAFEPGDLRKSMWVQQYTASSSGQIFYYPFKYKIKDDNQPVSEYYMVLRLSEQYLIRAEARIEMGNIDNGINDLNALRTRARGGNPDDLPALPSGLSKIDALAKVEQERRTELFAEWGHRWFDLKRWDRTDAVLAPVKDGNWEPEDKFFPVPQSEIQNNPNLAD